MHKNYESGLPVQKKNALLPSQPNFTENYLYLFLLFLLFYLPPSLCGGWAECCLSLISCALLWKSSLAVVIRTHPPGHRACSGMATRSEMIQTGGGSEGQSDGWGGAVCKCDAWNCCRCHATMRKASLKVRLAQRTEARHEQSAGAEL